MIIYGLNPVREALRGGRIQEVRVASRADERLQHIVREARQQGVTVRVVDAAELDREAGRGVHQGIVATLAGLKDHSVRELVGERNRPTLLVVVDGVEDPHNLGAIVRTVDAAGADGIVVQTRRSAALTGAAVKASAGALAHVRVAEVVNIARAIDELKECGVWVVGLAAEADSGYDAVDLTLPVALVVGAEGSGLRRLVREKCDFLAKIPMLGEVASLNVSVATGVVLFEAVRQRAAVARRRPH